MFDTAVEQLGAALGLLGQLFHHRRPIGVTRVGFTGRGTGVIYDPHGLEHPLRQRLINRVYRFGGNGGVGMRRRGVHLTPEALDVPAVP